MKDELKKRIKNSINGRKFREFKEDENADKFIVNNSANAEVEKLSETLFASISKNLSETVKELLMPSYEFNHIREQGLKIWGKKDNVAFSKSTILEIFSSFEDVCTNDVFQKTLFLAGRKAALSFFDDFKAVLLIDDTYHVPKDVISFLRLLSVFDSRSAWWRDEISYGQEKKAISVRIRNPFWRYPWFEIKNHNFTHFIAGYILTLHNCSFDFLRMISQNCNWVFKDSFAYDVKIYTDHDASNSSLQISQTEFDVEQFDIIDSLIFALSEWLFTDQSFNDNKDDVFSYFDLIQSSAKTIFHQTFTFDENILATTKENHSRNTTTYNRYILNSILKDIQLQYEDLRINVLKGTIEK